MDESYTQFLSSARGGFDCAGSSCICVRGSVFVDDVRKSVPVDVCGGVGVCVDSCVRTDGCAGSCTDGCADVCADVCAGVCADVCVGVFVDGVRLSVPVDDVCAGVPVGVCAGVCVDGVGVCTDVVVDVCAGVGVCTDVCVSDAI